MKRSEKVRGRNVRLAQAIFTESPAALFIVKAVFLGVKEEVKAVCGDIVANKSLYLDGSAHVRMESRPFPVRLQIREIKPSAYAIGEVWYPEVLKNVVTGQLHDLAVHAFDVFQARYRETIPLVEEFSEILWELALTKGYAQEIGSFGLPPEEQVYLLKLPDEEEFEKDLLGVMPRLHAKAEQAMPLPDCPVAA